MRQIQKNIILFLIIFVFSFVASKPSYAAASESNPVASASEEISSNDLFSKFVSMGTSPLDKLFRGPDKPDWIKRIYHGYSFSEDLKPTFYLETVQPLYQDTEKINTLFVEPRVSYESSPDEDVYNLGLGYRLYLKGPDLLLGVNSFVDYQRNHSHLRSGIGGEILGQYLEARVNGYFRMSGSKRIQETDTLIIYERVVNGLDWEIGTTIPYMPFAKIYGGGEFYDFRYAKNDVGWKGRLELKPFSFSTINVEVRDDNKGPAEWVVDSRFNFDFDDISFLKHAFSSTAYPKRNIRQMALNRVERDFHITKERYSVSKVSNAKVEIGRA